GDVHRLDSTVVARIRELAQTYPDDRIATLLNAEGFTTQQGLPWTYRRVLDTRRRHHLPTACPITPRGYQPQGDGLVAVHTAAKQFQTSCSTSLNWARRGLLYSEQKAGICPLWVRVLPEDVARYAANHNSSLFCRAAAWAICCSVAGVIWGMPMGGR